MGNTCGGVAGACCSNDINIDLNQQEVYNRKDGKGGDKDKMKRQNYMSLKELPNLPDSDPNKQKAIKLITKLQSAARGHSIRSKFR